MADVACMVYVTCMFSLWICVAYLYLFIYSFSYLLIYIYSHCIFLLLLLLSLLLFYCYYYYYYYYYYIIIFIFFFFILFSLFPKILIYLFYLLIYLGKKWFLKKKNWWGSGNGRWEGEVRRLREKILKVFRMRRHFWGDF